MERFRDKPGTALTCLSERKPVAVRAQPQLPPLGVLDPSETEAVLLALTRLMEQRDPHTAAHCERLAYTGVAMGMAMNLDHDSLQTLYIGGSLHDIGKVAIPDSILFKPGKLTIEEWRTMRAHPVLGEEVCRPLPALRKALPLIRHHHERWDGSGYPDGLRGDDIPLLARVLQLVDIYDALTNPRSYRGASSSAHALQILEEETERGWRDPELTALFVHMHRHVFSGAGYYPVVAESPSDSIDTSLQNLRTYMAG